MMTRKSCASHSATRRDAMRAGRCAGRRARVVATAESRRRRARAEKRGKTSTSIEPPPRGHEVKTDARASLRGDRWRVYDVRVALEEDLGKDSHEVTPALTKQLAKLLGTRGDADALARGTEVRRKTCDARSVVRGRVVGPGFSYVVDVSDEAISSAGGTARPLRERAKKLERAAGEREGGLGANAEALREAYERAPTRGNDASSTSMSDTFPDDDDKVIVVGLGPAGLFAALALAEAGERVVVVERGQPVEERGRDIGALFARRQLNGESNLCYGEGGAGTWSDGKLTTRIGRNSERVRAVLQALVAFGAPDDILVSGKPHLGTDRLVRILRTARRYMQGLGVEFRFGERCERIDRDPNTGAAGGVTLASGDVIRGKAVILAVGHSSRALMESLHLDGVKLSYQSFSAGFRIEHPQGMLDTLQYGSKYAGYVDNGKGPLPVADYRVANTVQDGIAAGRACYSFCMCPGGQIVPTSTTEDELCINGMSFSKRSSKWANSGLVSSISEADASPFAEVGYEPLCGFAFQRHIEREAAVMGGGGLVVPVQTAEDFLNETVSDVATLPSSSYRLGVKTAPLHELYPPAVTQAIRESLFRFNKQLPGFAGPQALIHAPEARTSSPVRVDREKETLMSVSMPGMYPIGEGAGYAGGIVSAAVDGLAAAETLLEMSGKRR